MINNLKKDARGLFIGSVVALLCSGSVAAEPITVVSWGGSYGAAQEMRYSMMPQKTPESTLIVSPVQVCPRPVCR